MKKIKYLLGLSILGFGLFINQTFGANAKIEGVTIPAGIKMSYIDFSESANYLYNFSYHQATTNGTATPYVRFFGFNRYYDGSNNQSYTLHQTFGGADCPAFYSTIQLNSSVFGQSLYSGRCVYGGGNSRLRMSSNMPNLPRGQSFDSSQKIILGNYTNFGNAFVYVGTLTDPDPSPKYGFGGGYFSNNSYGLINPSNIDPYPLRLFYYRNANGTSPLDEFDINTNSGPYSSNFFARQYQTPQGTRYQVSNMTSPKNFADLGGSYSKGLVTAGYGMGYSFGIRKSLSKTMTWEDFDFVSVGSKCLQTLYTEGHSDQYSQTKQGCQQIGFMVLKGNTYVSASNNEPVIVLSKDLNDHTKILYETFDCYEDDIQRIVSPQFCNSIGHGYLSVNGTGSLLPFTESGSTYTVSTGGQGILNMFVGDFRYGEISHKSNGFGLYAISYEGGTSLYVEFTFNPTPDSSSILDYYRAGLLGYTGSASNSGVVNDGSEVSNSSSLYYNCLGPGYDGTGVPPAYCYDENGVLNPDRLKNCSQVVDSNYNVHVYCTIDGVQQEINFQEMGSGYIIVPGDTNTNLLDVLNVPGYSEEYFDGYLNSKGYFFKCPFPYNSNLTIWPKLISLLNGYDINLPINCSFAGFTQGRNFLSDNFNLHIVDNGPIFDSDSDYANLLFRFVDFILLLGIIFLFSKVFRIFK